MNEERLERKLLAIQDECAQIHHLLRETRREMHQEFDRLSAHRATEALRLSVTAVVGKRSKPMIKPVPALTLSDVERVHLSLAPKLADGSADPGPFTWTSDNTAIAQIVGEDASGAPDPTNTAPTTPNVWLLTPAGPGVVTITAESANPDVDGNSIEITITEGRHGDVNLSAGTPVSDL